MKIPSFFIIVFHCHPDWRCVGWNSNCRAHASLPNRFIRNGVCCCFDRAVMAPALHPDKAKSAGKTDHPNSIFRRRRGDEVLFKGEVKSEPTNVGCYKVHPAFGSRRRPWLLQSLPEFRARWTHLPPALKSYLPVQSNCPLAPRATNSWRRSAAATRRWVVKSSRF